MHRGSFEPDPDDSDCQWFPEWVYSLLRLLIATGLAILLLQVVACSQLSSREAVMLREPIPENEDPRSKVASSEVKRLQVLGLWLRQMHSGFGVPPLGARV